MSALRPRSRGVFVDVSAAVSVAIALGVRADTALALLSDFASGVNAAMKKAYDQENAHDG